MEEIKKSPAIITVETTKLDFFDGYKLQKEAEIYLKEEIYNLIIDMSNVNYISSRGLGILVDIHKKCQKSGKLILCGLSDDVMSVFKLTVLNNFFIIVGSQEEAVSLMNKG
ncbi:MAG: STAS domain-containing protein [Vampirovibrionia bacterium]